MKYSNSFFISCKKAAEMIEMKQEGVLSFRGKLKLKVHLINCKLCTNYEKQSEIIDKGLKSILEFKDFGFKISHNKELKERIKSKLFNV